MKEKKSKRLSRSSPGFSRRIHTGCIIGILAVVCMGCDGAVPFSDSGLKELQEGQKKILERLEALEKSQKEILTAAKGRGRQRPKVDYNKVHKIPDGKSAERGAKKAKVTIVEFSDYQCPFSKRAQPLINQLLEAFPNDLKHVFKNFPLRFHKRAEPAAKACIAAGNQGKFWEMQALVFENPKKLEDEDLKGYAEKLALDMGRFNSDFQSKDAAKEIQDDMALGRKVGVTGTPTLFINGKRVKQRNFEAMKADIEKHKAGG